jgi:hypothetical protein
MSGPIGSNDAPVDLTVGEDLRDVPALAAAVVAAGKASSNTAANNRSTTALRRHRPDARNDGAILRWRSSHVSAFPVQLFS